MTTPAPPAPAAAPPAPPVPPPPAAPAVPGPEAPATPAAGDSAPTQRWVIPVMPLVLIIILFAVGLALLLIDLFGAVWGSVITAAVVGVIIAAFLFIRSRRRNGKGLLGRSRNGLGSSRFGRGGRFGLGGGRGGLFGRGGGGLFGKGKTGSGGGLGSRLRSALGLGGGKGKNGLGKTSSGLGLGSGSKTGLGKGSSGSGSGSTSSRTHKKGSGNDAEPGDSLVKKAANAAWERFKQARQQEEAAETEQAPSNGGKDTVSTQPAADAGAVAGAGPDASFLRWGTHLAPAANKVAEFSGYTTHQANVAANMPLTPAFKDEMAEIARLIEAAATRAAEWEAIWQAQSHEDIDDLLHPKGGPHVAAKGDVERSWN